MTVTVLGIDLGTSSVKTVVSTPDGRVLAEARGEYAVDHPRPGWAQSDPQDWLDATVDTVRRAVAAAAGRGAAAPSGIGFSGQMHGVVVADGTGTPIRPAMLWSDSRAVAQLEGYRSLPEPARRRLANPLSPGMAGPMLAWLRREEPASLARTTWALQPKDWLRSRLTGMFHAEPSDASATLLYDLTRDDWDDDVLADLGLDRAILAPILPSSAAVAGHLTRDAAGVLGLTAGIPVAAGAADTAAAALGSGLSDPDTIQLTIGTGGQIVRPVTVLPAPLTAEPVTHLYRAATTAGWYRMAAVLNGGLTLDWVRRVLGGVSWPELYAAAGRDPQPDDAYFLPHVHGERTPYLDPDLRGAWTGLAPQHERADLLRAALEGVALALREALAHLVTRADDEATLRLAGGGTADPAWRQLLADVLDHPLEPVDITAASGLGAALLGALAADLTDEPTVLARRPGSGQVTTKPRKEFESHYQKRCLIFHAQVHALQAAQGRVSTP